MSLHIALALKVHACRPRRLRQAEGAPDLSDSDAGTANAGALYAECRRIVNQHGCLAHMRAEVRSADTRGHPAVARMWLRLNGPDPRREQALTAALARGDVSRYMWARVKR